MWPFKKKEIIDERTQIQLEEVKRIRRAIRVNELCGLDMENSVLFVSQETHNILFILRHQQEQKHTFDGMPLIVDRKIKSGWYIK